MKNIVILFEFQKNIPKPAPVFDFIFPELHDSDISSLISNYVGRSEVE
jgi:hypothetical protein